MTTTINGSKAQHAIITPNCIVTHGVDGAIDEALKRLCKSFMECYRGWASEGKVPEFHVVLTVDRDAVIELEPM